MEVPTEQLEQCPYDPATQCSKVRECEGCACETYNTALEQYRFTRKELGDEVQGRGHGTDQVEGLD